jgi:serine/threonine protein kinase
MGQGARWEHVRELGEGGMGRVSLARRTLLDGVTQRVVVKRAHGGDEAVRRLRAEARALACIDHGNVVKLLDAGEDADGPFLVLEHVDGVDAHALLEDARADAAMDPQEVAWLLFEASRGVAAAHGARTFEGEALALVHRDLSPQNLLASVRGDVKVADFGIAWSQTPANRTTTGVVVGNPRFIAPEQLEGRHAGPATDVFGLGRVLEELLAVTAPSPPRAALADLASLATRRLPEDRPADAERLADALLDAVPTLPRGRTLLAARVARISDTRARIHHALRGMLDDDPPLPPRAHRGRGAREDRDGARARGRRAGRSARGSSGLLAVDGGRRGVAGAGGLRRAPAPRATGVDAAGRGGDASRSRGAAVGARGDEHPRGAVDPRGGGRGRGAPAAAAHPAARCASDAEREP